LKSKKPKLQPRINANENSRLSAAETFTNLQGSISLGEVAMRHPKFLIAALEAFILLFASVLIAALFNHVSSKPLSWNAPERSLSHANDSLFTDDVFLPEVHVGAGNGNSSAGPALITLEQAHSLHSENKAVFLDARDRERYESGHVEGARHAPYHDKDRMERALENHAKETTLVLYCDAGCDSATRLAEVLIKRGYNRIFVLDAGYEEWYNAYYPVTLDGE